MHLGFEIKPNGFSRKTGGYLSSRDGGGGERLRRVAASGERRRGSGGRRRCSGGWRVGVWARRTLATVHTQGEHFYLDN